jgi:hypothetical protein
MAAPAAVASLETGMYWRWMGSFSGVKSPA